MSARPTRARLVACAAIVAGVVAVCAPAGADADDADVLRTAEREFQAGFRALEAGNCHVALEHYQRSYELVARPRTLFNMAVCQEELGQGAAAWRSYHAFLRAAEPRDATIVERARRRVEVLRARLRGRAFVDSTPSGAAVYIDGEVHPRGTTPLALVLAPGTHRLRLVAGNAPPVERTLEIEPDGVATASIELAAPASITIEVEPADALVAWNGDGDAPTRGRFHAEVATGRHVFAVRRDGYAPREVTIDAAPGRTHTERIVLRPLPAPGRVHVVRARDARVTLDRSPLTLHMREVGSGTHQLVVEQPGHHAYRGAVAVAPGEDVTITVQLPRRRARALVWGLTGAGAGAITAGGVLGVLALRDVSSPIADDHGRGKSRALVADGLLVTGAVALFVAWRASRPAAAAVTIDRRRRTR